MCGIWAYILKSRGELSDELKSRLYTSFLKVKHRGPDRSDFIEFDLLLPFFLGFHRLAIMDKSVNGDQPFVMSWKGRTIYTLCNGELYNYQRLKAKYNLEMHSDCDCEVIPLIYRDHGIETLVNEVKSGEFAFIILDIDMEAKRVVLHVGHDPTGVRPLFYAEDKDGIAFSSELGGIVGIVDQKEVKLFPPGSYMTMTLDLNGKVNIVRELVKYVDFDKIPPFVEPNGLDVFGEVYLDKACAKVNSQNIGRYRFRHDESRSTHRRLTFRRIRFQPRGWLAARELRKTGKKLRTFSIGMPGGTDGPFAQRVADFCGTEHTHFELTTQDFLDAIVDVIRAIGTFDITTVRASVGQYLVCKKISEETDIKVLLIGDGSDELCSGYMYFHKAPSPQESHLENCRLLKEIGMYDVLRADRGVARHGLEARCPFLSYDFINLYLNLDARIRVPVEGVEKWLLRRAFGQGEAIIPEDVRVRPKCAFSDGVSKREKSWFEIIGEMADGLYKKEELEGVGEKYKHVPPISMESLYYRKTFEQFYGQTAHVIPHFWLPKWCGDIKEPSARVLEVCRE
ncbi:Asparagine synthetase [glutamine-hydrolyzing] [Orchesella cincta]|uniref:Asparagine synthetase [glutamine-hydrolyzing] n=1 Tax=Orchesella cincta TaxID=48709 RepID=A0A1D2MFZ5_ORCCI|nr:Asparagine synthetase [glutamine-hydrolyzing] [Orchesella cincta]